MIRFHAETFHAAEHGQEAYYATRIDAMFSEDNDYSATVLAVAGMVEMLQGMFAGDHVRLTVGCIEVGTWELTFDQIVKRADPDLLRIAREIEFKA